MAHEPDDHDGGLGFDLAHLLGRRQALRVFAGTGLLAVVGRRAVAGTSEPDSSVPGTDAVCSPIPEETAGPFPGDGSNGPNVLAESGIVRSDITTSLGDASGVAEGIPLTIELVLTDTSNSCAPFAGAAVYLWHCDREGRYSIYSEGATEENYLRGVQEADADGLVTFQSIFPAAYAGRWPHIHFEVYASLDEATGAGTILATSQLAFPDQICQEVFATAGYEQSITNHAQTSLDDDIVFSDGSDQQLGTIAGTIEGEDLTVELTIAV